MEIEINPTGALEQALKLLLSGVEQANGLQPGSLTMPAQPYITNVARKIFGGVE